MTLPRVIDLKSGGWQEHPRFPDIFIKGLLTPSDNPFANVNLIKVPPGGKVNCHYHTQQFETVLVIEGNVILILDQTEVSIADGQLISIPVGVEHALRNESPDPVELLTFFTPPLP